MTETARVWSPRKIYNIKYQVHILLIDYLKWGGGLFFHSVIVIIYNTHYSNAKLLEKKKVMFSEEREKIK